MLCNECGIYFEIACEKVIDPQELICVDCGVPDVRLLRTDEELSTRLNNLISAVQEIAQRIETLEDQILDEPGPDNTSGKSKKTVN